MLGPVLFILCATPLSLIIEKHSVNHEMFADDTQLYKSVPLTDYDSMAPLLQKCTADVKDWILGTALNMVISLILCCSVHFSPFTDCLQDGLFKDRTAEL